MHLVAYCTGEFGGWHPAGQCQWIHWSTRSTWVWFVSFSNGFWRNWKIAFLFRRALVIPIPEIRHGEWLLFQLIELPNINSREVERKVSEESWITAHIESVRYEKDCRGLKVAQWQTLRNHIHWRFMNKRINCLIILYDYLLALGSFDKAKDKEENIVRLYLQINAVHVFQKMQFPFRSIRKHVSYRIWWICCRSESSITSSLTNSSDWILFVAIPMVQK